MIGFAQPWALLSLLAVPLLIYLYRQRPQREDATVSTLMFWQEAIKIRDGQRSFRRWMKDINLLVLLLLALLLGLALAQPQWRTTAEYSQDAILIIDSSASMGARTAIPGRNRFDEAKRKALQIIDALPDNTTLLVMTSARHARPLSGFESDRELLKTIVATLQPTEESGNPAAALKLARSLLRNRRQAQLHFITDGAFDADSAVATAGTEFHFVGDRRNNAAITRFDVRTTLHGDNAHEAFEAFVAIRNFSDETIDVPFSFSMDSRVLHQQSLNIKAGHELTLSLPLSGPLGSRATAAITINDALDADNSAYMAFSSPAPRRVLLLTPGNFYLETALRELPSTTLEVKQAQTAQDNTEPTDSTDTTMTSARLQSYDLVVFDRVQPPPLQTGQYLLIDTAPAGSNLETAERTDTTFVDGIAQHALMRDLDLSQLRIAAPRKIDTRQINDRGALNQPLFWSSDTDLALSTLQPDMRMVYLGFDLLQSNFPRQAAFPLFIRRSVDWLTASTLTTNQQGNRAVNHERRRQFPAGESFTLTFAPGTEELIIAAPDGSAQAIALTSARYTFTDTAQAGFYQYTADGVQHYVAANLTDETESAINRRLSVAANNSPKPTARTGIIKLTLWPYLAWGALLLLTLEWWLWCTRREYV